MDFDDLENELCSLAMAYRGGESVVERYHEVYTELRERGYTRSLDPDCELPDKDMPDSHHEWLRRLIGKPPRL